MSLDAYKIAVKIQLTENVTRGLMAMGPHFSAANKGAKELEATMSRISKLALLGGGMVGIGAVAFKALEKPLNAAKEWETQLAKLRQMGLGDSQITEAQKFVQANDVIGKSMQDRLRLFTDAQGAFRESGRSGSEALEAAKVMMPVLGTYETASQTLSGHQKAAAEHAMSSLNKTIDIMGGLKSLEKAQEIADGVFKAVQSSGGMVNEQQLKQFVGYGGSATDSISPRIIFGGLEPIIGEYSGSRVGVAFRTAFNRMSGAMALSPKLMQSQLMALEIGKLDHGKVRLNDQMLKIMQTDPIQFASKLMDVYEAHGIKSVLDRNRENSILLSPTSANIYNRVMAQMSVLQASLKSYDMAKGASEVVNDPRNAPLIAQQVYEARMADFQLALGRNGGLLEMSTKALTAFSRSIEEVTSFANRHPTLTKFGVEGSALVAGLLIAGGTVKMFRASIEALGLLRIGGIATSLGEGAGLAGAIGGLANPATLATAGIAGLVGAVYSMAKLLPMFMGDGIHDKINHPGQHFSRHGRGANNGVWIDDATGKVVTMAQHQAFEDARKKSAIAAKYIHEGQHYESGGRGGPGRWVDDYVRTRSDAQSSKPTTVQLVLKDGGRPLAEVVSSVQSSKLLNAFSAGSYDNQIHQPLLSQR